MQSVGAEFEPLQTLEIAECGWNGAGEIVCVEWKVDRRSELADGRRNGAREVFEIPQVEDAEGERLMQGSCHASHYGVHGRLDALN